MPSGAPKTAQSGAPFALDPALCEQARLSRDARFDGLFFTGVHSTGIYCRPVCPARPPLARNVRYYPHPAAAEAAGLRPCLRCRPELAPGHRWATGADALLDRALNLVDAGALDEGGVPALCAQLGVGERHLRRLFAERIGAAPLQVHTSRRLLFAKQLLTESTLPVVQVALAAGFRSLRRFNAAFAAAYAMPPTALRRSAGVPSLRSSTTPVVKASSRATVDLEAVLPDAAPAPAPAPTPAPAPQPAPQPAPMLAPQPLVLRLAYRPPLAWTAWLEAMALRALPGVEAVDAQSYARALGGPQLAPGAWMRLSAWGDGSPQLRLELHGVPPAALLQTVQRVRRMVDLDAEPERIDGVLRTVPQLAASVQQQPGLRLACAWDGFEVVVRAIVGQQVSVAAARTVVGRIVQRFGAPLPSAAGTPAGVAVAFPTPEALLEADLQPLGMTAARAATVRAVAQALQDGRVSLAAGQTLDEFVAAWTALPGIGDWTAHYLALRALGHPDAFPAGDLVLQHSVPTDGSRLSARALTHWAEPLRPWRAYAVWHLWRIAAERARLARRT